ncbi:MAG TPA: hypothetical protein VFV49_17500, partial [Thermoanaerobaculia bacterium]|nr:hypothetical protein [Thermoanaerobaculia bacterium]
MAVSFREAGCCCIAANIKVSVVPFSFGRANLSFIGTKISSIRASLEVAHMDISCGETTLEVKRLGRQLRRSWIPQETSRRRAAPTLLLHQENERHSMGCGAR